MKTSHKSPVSRLLMTVTLVFFAHSASAALLTQNFDAEQVGDGNLELVLHPFDPSLGTLLAVSWTFTGNSRISTDQFVCTSLGPPCIARGFAAVDWFSGNVVTSGRHTTDNFHTFAAGEIKTVSTFSGRALSYNSAVQDLSSFSLFAPRLVGSDTWRCESGCTGVGAGTQRIVGSLTYRYDESTATTPVPATVALIALGLVGLRTSRRRSV